MGAQDVLERSRVVFNEVEHTYTLDGKTLSGVTTLLHKYLFADKYADIPQSVLDKAAEYGHKVHDEVQMFINNMPYDKMLPEVVSWTTSVKGRNFVESEFLVDYNGIIASSIDAIELTDKGIVLWDWKTTSKFDEKYLAWQLGIYKYMFERQTGIEVTAVKCGWFVKTKKQFREIDITPVSADNVVALFNAYEANADTFANPTTQDTIDITKSCESELITLADLEAFIADNDARVKEAKAQQQEIKDRLMKIMTDNALTKIETDNICISLKEGYARSGVDTARLKKEKPEIYSEYEKTTMVASSLTIKIKNR